MCARARERERDRDGGGSGVAAGWEGGASERASKKQERSVGLRASGARARARQSDTPPMAEGGDECPRVCARV